MDEQKPQKAKIKHWPVRVSDEARYRATLIAALYKMKIGDVLERAIVCYANVLRVNDKMEQEFPKEGLETPERTGKPRRPPTTLKNFQEHSNFFASRKAQPVVAEDEEQPQ